MMKVIAITGSLGSGKSTVARMLEQRGAKVIDADAMAHQLLENTTSCFKALEKRFGARIVKNGRIDRRELAGLIFESKENRRFVERVLHPEVIRETRARLEAWRRRGVKSAVLDVPLLFESGMDRLADVTVAVRAEEAQQVERARLARGWSADEVRKRIAAQMPQEEKIHLADWVIDNRGLRKETEQQVEAFWQECCRSDREEGT